MAGFFYGACLPIRHIRQSLTSYALINSMDSDHVVDWAPQHLETKEND